MSSSTLSWSDQLYIHQFFPSALFNLLFKLFWGCLSAALDCLLQCSAILQWSFPSWNTVHKVHNSNVFTEFKQAQGKQNNLSGPLLKWGYKCPLACYVGFFTVLFSTASWSLFSVWSGKIIFSFQHDETFFHLFVLSCKKKEIYLLSINEPLTPNFPCSASSHEIYYWVL